MAGENRILLKDKKEKKINKGSYFLPIYNSLKF